MDLAPYVEHLHDQLLNAADAGGEQARALATRLLAPLDAAVRLTLQDALAAAAEEITCELAPGAVELRLRGRDPEFVVTAPAVDSPADDTGDSAAAPADGEGAQPPNPDDGAMSRINLRMPDRLKARVEHAAAGEGVSVNSWLVRAATAALERTDSGSRRPSQGTGPRRYTGWVR